MKSVSLVLGSGGARGYTHIGVIEELIEQGFEIRSISGSSMGALIGALYACGKLEDYKKWVKTLSKFDVVKLLDITFAHSGFIKGEKVFKNLEEFFGKKKIEQLPIKFTAVATDLTAKKEVWFQKGDLQTAVRASISIPTIMTPKEINGHFFIDGGVINPLPVAPTISDMTDLTICVNLNADIPNTYKIETKDAKKEVLKTKELEKPSYFEIMRTSINLMQTALSRYKTAEYTPDITINIPIAIGDFYEFYKATEFIKIGQEATKRALSEKFPNS